MAPLNDLSWEFWTLGPGGKDTNRWERLFEIHGNGYWPEGFRGYLQELSEVQPPRIIYTEDAMPDWPANVVIPKQHFPDVRELDATAGAALMATVSRITNAVAAAFPNQGISLWHSIGPAAFQEVPHLHIHVHVHPRRTDDGFLQGYPGSPFRADRATRDSYAERLRECL